MTKSTNLIDHHVGSRVRLGRKVVGLSQEKFAQLVGVSPPQLQKYEAGSNRIGAGRLFLMARILGVTPQFFFEEMPEAATDILPPAPEQAGRLVRPLMDFAGSNEGVELNTAFNRLEDAAIRQALVKLAQAIAIGDTDYRRSRRDVS